MLCFSKIPRVRMRNPWRQTQGPRDQRARCRGKVPPRPPHNQPTRLTHEEVRKTLPNKTSPRRTSPHFQPLDLPADSLNSRGSSENKRSRYMTVQRLKDIQTHSLITSAKVWGPTSRLTLQPNTLLNKAINLMPVKWTLELYRF